MNFNFNIKDIPRLFEASIRERTIGCDQNHMVRFER